MSAKLNGKSIVTLSTDTMGLWEEEKAKSVIRSRLSSAHAEARSRGQSAPKEMKNSGWREQRSGEGNRPLSASHYSVNTPVVKE